LADDVTASAILRHCDGVQAGVCQRIFSFTAQIVFVRHESPVGVDAAGAGAGTGSADSAAAARGGECEKVAAPVRAAAQAA
jgi:hypothetical protein